jgi:hypothetical protein
MMATTMSPDNQIVIPPSFVAVYTDPGKHKPREPWDHVAQRYELCEDMAQMLVNPARVNRCTSWASPPMTWPTPACKAC